MELKSKTKFSKTLQSLVDIQKDCEIPAQRTENLKDAVDNMNLLVPVVGEFSAGKSSLLNKFIGKNILSVGMAPETAVPAELYYSETEYNEGVLPDGCTEKISDVSSAASKYVCVKRYINSDYLKEIQPIVLVDMPGFDSPLDAHNKAIFNYLDKGCHYVVITPVDAGTVSSSMSKQIQNILTFNKKCTYFVSKTDLRSDEEVEQVKKELALELGSITGETEIVYGISQNDISLFNNFAQSLNPDELYRTTFESTVKDSCYDVKASLNTKIAALKNDKTKNTHAVEELRNSLRKIEDKKAKLIENAKKDTYAEESDNVANAVGQALNSQLDSLASIALSGGSEALQEELNSIVQGTVVAKINTIMTSVTTKFSNDFNKEFDNLTGILEEYNASEVMTKLQDGARTLYDSSTTAISQFLSDKKGSSSSKVLTTVLTAAGGIFAAATTVFAPVVEVIIILLPSILNKIFEKAQEKQQLEKIKQNIIGQIPVIKREIRGKVSQVLQENSANMISSISEKYDEELRQKAEEIEKASKELEESTDIEGTIQKLSNNVQKVEQLISELM
ncbi:MAG: dynamin family protein [Spirochaetales bacterium]|nr:dynamin family protein [Spirochaetales bacterium]MDY5915789.1 dynamin family protein [Treponema sp.]